MHKGDYNFLDLFFTARVVGFVATLPLACYVEKNVYWTRWRMDDLDFLNALTWHLDCMALSLGEIERCHPPADIFQMRMYYSLYVSNFMSAVDFVSEKCGVPFNATLEASLSTLSLSGADVIGYLRELRNGVIHRGLDPASGGRVIKGVVYAVAPLK
jgi:hypothetical protein